MASRTPGTPATHGKVVIYLLSATIANASTCNSVDFIVLSVCVPCVTVSDQGREQRPTRHSSSGPHGIRLRRVCISQRTEARRRVHRRRAEAPRRNRGDQPALAENRRRHALQDAPPGHHGHCCAPTLGRSLPPHTRCVDWSPSQKCRLHDCILQSTSSIGRVTGGGGGHLAVAEAGSLLKGVGGFLVFFFPSLLCSNLLYVL